MSEAELNPGPHPSMPSCPTTQRWRHWLADPDSHEVDSGELAAHLDGCEDCQSEVARVSRSDAFFSLSRETLRRSGLSSHDWRQAANSTPDDRSPTDTESPLVSVVRSLLGPTDEEHSLGRLGRFEVIGVVGSGGMGIVLKARSIDMDRIVAIKIPLPQYWRSADLLCTLEREARSASSVVHPNVISIYHVDRYRDVPYLVMPWLPGQSLQQRIEQAGPLPVTEIVTISRQVASALAAAHACGVVHRDVKPANILLGTGTDRVVLSDFGLAKVGADATRTATGMCAGTPMYLSPEQASGLEVGPAADIYALGTVLWTMACGQPPMAGLHAHAIVRRIADAEFPSLEHGTDDRPSWLVTLVERLHAKSPDQRPGANELTLWLESCQKHLNDPDAFDLPEALDDRSQKHAWLRSPEKWIAAIAAILCVVAAIQFGPALLRGEQNQPASQTSEQKHASVPASTGSPRPTGPAKSESATAPRQSDASLGLASENAVTDQSESTGDGRSASSSKLSTPAPDPKTGAPPVQSTTPTPSAALPALDSYLQSVRDELDQVLGETLPRLDEELERLEQSP